MSVAHTPGPWHRDTWGGALAGYNASAVHEGVHHAVWAGDLLICTTGLTGTPEAAENADLIKAAPLLLAALRAVESVLVRCDAETNYGGQEHCTDEEWDAALVSARTAIAAAEGRS